MIIASEVLDCYDGELNQLADLAGDFDAASPADLKRWIIGQWENVADLLGWRSALDETFSGLGADLGIDVVNAAAATAYENWLARRQSTQLRPYNPETPQSHRERARVMHTSLEAITTIGLGQRNLWWPSIPSTGLPNNACYSSADTSPSDFTSKTPLATSNEIAANLAVARAIGMDLRERPVERGLRRAFRADVAPSYFGPKGGTAVGCTYPVILSLGTYPYVYGGVLGRVAPAFYWAAGRPWSPARLGMAAAASFWTAEGNLAQDARIAVTQYKHFRRTTARLLDAVRTLRPEARPIPGQLYRRGGLLHVYQGSLSMLALRGPRGVVGAASYNYVKMRFAGFFAARRAYLRAYESLSPGARSALARNPDPCLVRENGLNLVAEIGA